VTNVTLVVTNDIFYGFLSLVMTVALSISAFATVTLNGISLVVKFICDYPPENPQRPIFPRRDSSFPRHGAISSEWNHDETLAIETEIFGFTEVANYLRKRITKISS